MAKVLEILIIARLLLLNDNINSVARIIANLTEVMNWSIYQAEQCAILADGVGQIELTKGSIKELKELQSKFKKVNIATQIVSK